MPRVLTNGQPTIIAYRWPISTRIKRRTAAVTAKELIVVGGPNGAGKSTFVAPFLADRPMPYLCADVIATEFQHLDATSQQIAAGREFLRRMEWQLTKEENFVSRRRFREEPCVRF